MGEWAVSEFPFVEVDVTAPRQDQYQEVMDRFKEHVRQSGLDAFRTKNNISHQKFERTLERQDGEHVPVEADVKARSAWGSGDALRGLHGHLGVLDESQDTDEGMFSNFLEVVDQSVSQVDYFPTIVLIGTPKMTGSFFHNIWQMSDQKTWDDDAGEWVSEGDADEFMPPSMRERRDEIDDTLERLRDRLGDAGEDERERIEERIAELEAERDDIPSYSVTGWHIDQYASPLHDNAKIEFKREQYSEKEFRNEVLAEFYTPENDLLTDGDVENALVDATFTRGRVFSDSEVIIGVDWGGGDSSEASDTVIVVLERIAEDDGDKRLIVRDLDFVDSDANKQEELEAVEQRIRDYEADRVAVDEGYGSKQREDLQDGNNIWNDDGWDQVCGTIYGNVSDQGSPSFQESGYEDSRYCTVARTHMCESMVADFKDGNIEIPKNDLSFARDGDGTKLVDQLTAPYTDRKETAGGKRKKKVLADRNDDAFHALVFAWIAAEKFGTRRTVRSVSTNTRRGY